MSIKDLLINVITSGKYANTREDRDKGISDYIIRYVLLNFISIVGSVILAGFIFVRFQQGKYGTVAACSVMFAIAVLTIVFSRMKKMPQTVPAVLLMVFYGLLCAAVTYLGEAEGSNVMFVYMYPSLTMILLGMMPGIFFSAALIVIVSLQMFIPELSRYDYPFTVPVHVIVTYFLVFSVMIVIETTRRIKDRTIARQNRQLLELKEKAEAMTRMKSDFLARMSHEIRTPMNAIIGMAELAMREKLTPAAQEQVATVKQAGASLLSLINDILDISKVESGKLEIVPADYELASLVNDVVSIVRMRVADTKVRFVANIDSRLPNKLFGDEIRIRQVLLNMLTNAVKYTDEGFVSLVINGKMVDEDNIELTVDVSDSGRGIREADIEKLFGEFVQVDIAANRGIEGTGLGLSIMKNLAEAMGGGVGVESEYGKGSKFTVKLPQKVASKEPFATVEKPEEKSVLIYERRDILADSIVATLDNLGVKSASVRDEAELREMLKENSEFGIRNSELTSKDKNQIGVDVDFYSEFRIPNSEFKNNGWAFLFVNSYLLDNAKMILEECGSTAQIVLLSNFGDAVVDRGLSVIAMPAHAISVANVLNGVADSLTGSADSLAAIRFTAPEARVLVVDDIGTNLKVAQGLLAPYRMQVDTAVSGKHAIGAVENNRYDVILMDHMMPGMDGIEATKRIRALDVNGSSSVPIIALTANAVSGAKEMFLQNGFNDFLPKPIDVGKLNRVLEKWIPEEKKTGEQVAVEIKTGVGVGGELSTDTEMLAMFVRDGRRGMEMINAEFGMRNAELTSKDKNQSDVDVDLSFRVPHSAFRIKDFTTHVHGLKSASANIGAMELSAAAKSLEDAGRRNDRQYIETHAPIFLTELERLLERIDTVLSVPKNNGGGAVADIDKDALNAALSDMRKALNDINPAAIKAAVKALQAFEGDANIGGAISEILQDVLGGDYDEAAGKIDAMICLLRA